jgi:hypothetical protein
MRERVKMSAARESFQISYETLDVLNRIGRYGKRWTTL